MKQRRCVINGEEFVIQWDHTEAVSQDIWSRVTISHNINGSWLVVVEGCKITNAELRLINRLLIDLSSKHTAKAKQKLNAPGK